MRHFLVAALAVALMACASQAPQSAGAGGDAAGTQPPKQRLCHDEAGTASRIPKMHKCDATATN